MSTQLQIISVLIIIFSLTPQGGFASEVFELGEIVVGPHEEEVGLQTSVLQITAADIEEKNAKTIEEALEFVPGVRITVGAKNEPEVMVRGFSQEKVLVLLDGIPIADPQYGYVDLNQIPVENISKIKVIKGSVPAIYGANTFGGVVNIVSKTAGTKPHMDLSSEVASDGATNCAINVGTKTERFNFWVSASRRRSDGFYLSNDFKGSCNEQGDRLENSDYEKNSISLKIGLTPNESHNAALSFIYIDNEKGIPPQANASRPKYWRFTEWKRKLFAITDELDLNEKFSIKMRAFYDKYDNTIDSYDDNTYTTQNASASWTSIYDEYAVGGNVHFQYEPNNAHTITGGLNFKRDLHKEQDDVGDPWETYELRTYSLSLEDEIKFLEKFSLSGGGSLDIFQQHEAYNSSMGDDEEVFNPLCKLKFSINPDREMYTSISRKTCFPTLNQLYSSTSGNPDLKEQTNTSYEIGLRQRLKKRNEIAISYFYNDVEDLIERASNDPYYNVNKAVFRGVEVATSLGLLDNFTGGVSYTYLDARDRTPETLGHSENELEYTPKHKADLNLKYKTDFGLSCLVFGSYHSKRYYYDTSENQHYIGGYTLWNTRFEKDIKSWQVNLGIENIFDRNYHEEDGYPQPGRTVKLGAKIEF